MKIQIKDPEKAKQQNEKRVKQTPDPSKLVTVLGRGYELSAPEKEIVLSIPDDFRKGHSWIFGTTRVGKTRLMENMIEQDIRKGYSVVYIDPKGDGELFSKFVQIAFEEQRHEELMLVTPIFPDYSAIIDPLSHYFMPEELVGHIISGVKEGKEPFFRNVAYEISLCIVNALLMLSREAGEERAFNLNDVKNLMSREELAKLKEQIDGIRSAEAEQLAKDMQKVIESDPAYYGKVSSSLRTALIELSSGNIGRIIGRADENRFIKRLENGERVLMAVQLGSLLTRQAANTVGKVVVSMIQALTGRVYNSGRIITPPLALYIDEAKNVLYSDIEDLFAMAGGAQVYIHGFSQSVNQMYAVLGQEKAKSILDNTNTKVFMRVPDAETAQYVCAHFGTHKKFSPVLSVGGLNASARELEEDNLKPEDVLKLKPREFFLQTYSGVFKGRTMDTSDSYIEIKFPDARAA